MGHNHIPPICVEDRNRNEMSTESQHDDLMDGWLRIAESDEEANVEFQSRGPDDEPPEMAIVQPETEKQ